MAQRLNPRVAATAAAAAAAGSTASSSAGNSAILDPDSDDAVASSAASPMTSAAASSAGGGGHDDSPATLSDAERRRMAGLGGSGVSVGGVPLSRRHRTVAAFVVMSLVLAAYVMGVAPSLPGLGRAIFRRNRASGPSDPLTRWTRRLAEGAALAAVREGIRPLPFREGHALVRPKRRKKQAEGDGEGGGGGGGGERVHVAVVSQGAQRNALVLSQLRLLMSSVAAHTRCPLTFHLVIPRTDLNATLSALRAFPAVRIHPLPNPFITITSPLSTNASGTTTASAADGSAAADAASSAAGSLQFDAVGASSGYQESKSDLRKLSAVPFLLAIHSLPTRWLGAQARLLGTHPNLSPDGPAALGRFLLADILWQVDAAILMQPDVIVGGDVQELWNMIEKSKGTSDLLSLIVPLEEVQVVGRGGEEEHLQQRQQQGGLLGMGGWWRRARARISLDTMRVGNGVLLMNLERLRLHGTGKLLSRALQHRPLASEPLFDHDRLESSLFHVVCHKFPRTCAPLSPLWAIDGCSPGVPFSGFSSHGRDAATGMCWMLVHMHCQAPVHADNVIEVKGTGQGGEVEGGYGGLKGGEGREQEREDVASVYRLPEGSGWEEAVQFAMNYFAANDGDARGR
ncbi:hypothetical protein CLOP_g8366 [Closterium sp. NIES-67]|nr:hypothetical protein CLOP_g8366 [Closterium sp. NIES-67]